MNWCRPFAKSAASNSEREAKLNGFNGLMHGVKDIFPVAWYGQENGEGVEKCVIGLLFEEIP